LLDVKRNERSSFCLRRNGSLKCVFCAQVFGCLGVVFVHCCYFSLSIASFSHSSDALKLNVESQCLTTTMMKNHSVVANIDTTVETPVHSAVYNIMTRRRLWSVATAPRNVHVPLHSATSVSSWLLFRRQSAVSMSFEGGQEVFASSYLSSGQISLQ